MISTGKKKHTVTSQGATAGYTDAKVEGAEKTNRPELSEKKPGRETFSEEKRFPIVGIGASAGGLEAFTKLLEELPDDTGMAFVFVQHLAPGQESMLTDILARSTAMPVHKVQNDMPVKPNNVYVIPPDVSMTIVDCTLKLQREVSRMHRPVDQFLISLAQDVKDLAIGVILSGTGTDGTEGLKAIYAEGGITFAQEEDSAKYPGMPHSAIASESVHFVLPPAKIASELARIGKHPYLNHSKLRVVKPKVEEADSFQNILAMLKLSFGVNFSAYKESTLNRRISRQMVLHQIDKIEDYVNSLRSDRNVLQALFDDLLIGVTSFFREPDTFQVLAEQVFPILVKNRSPETPIRIWVPGCATGEEVYSIALALREFQEKEGNVQPIQIFGTDISVKNIEKARAGIYPDSISENVSAKRLKHFFSAADQRYQISKSVRDMCVFAKQDLTRDPPFSNIDLISCRNVLIYLKPEAQKRIIALFHYALKPDGYLVLGKSENIGGFEELFATVDKAPVYLKKAGTSRLPIEIELGEPFQERRQAIRKRTAEGPLDRLQKEIERLLMIRFAPAGVVVNNDLDVLIFQGNTSQFLVHRPGEASFDLMKLVREEFRLELQTAIYLAKKQKTSIKRERIQFKSNGDFCEADLEVVPLEIPKSSEKFFLVLFEAVAPSPKRTRRKRFEEDTAGPMIEELKRELASTKETLQTIIEEQEATNEELRAALEEVQSSNEELQSTNEELETAKEELQSTNEELNTVNEELTRRNKEITRVHDDLTNLFGSIDVALIVLDPEFRIRLFTPTAERLFNLIPTDVGRPLSDFRLGMDVPNFEGLLREVMEGLGSKQMEVQDKKGRWYEVRLRPYLTADKKIDGVLLSFIDIDALVRSKQEIEKSRNFAETVLATMREPLVVLDADLKVAMANPSFYKTFDIEAGDAEQKSIYKVGDKQWQVSEFKQAIEKIGADGEPVNDIIIDHAFPKTGRKVLNVSMRQLYSKDAASKMILLTMEDITDRKRVEEELKKNTQSLEKLVEERTKKLQEAQRLAAIGQTAGMVGHDIRNPLQSIVSALYLLKNEIQALKDSEQKNSLTESVETIETQTSYISKIVSDLQDYARPITPVNEEIDVNRELDAVLSKARIPKNIHVEKIIDKDFPKIKTDQTCLTRILSNLVANAVQAMPDGGKLTLKAISEDSSAILTVEDTGVGIPEKLKPKIFQPLVTTKSKGQGFGLAVCKRLTEALLGNITFESQEDKGTKFTVRLPTK
ncbi:MAG: chemotaxis protein CheB [Candidatus Bathyarchaeia archaeon]